MCLAKSLANGLPAGALVASEEIADAFKPGDHGSTFGGGPVIAAAARATLKALDDERLGDNALRVGELPEGTAFARSPKRSRVSWPTFAGRA